MTVGMVRPVNAAMWALQVLPARKVHRVNGVLLALLVSRVRPVPMARLVKTVRMGVRWCLCTVPGAAWL